MLFLKKQAKKKPEHPNLLQNPKILEVNLIKDEVKVIFDWNKNLSILLIVLFITALFIAEIYLGLDWWEKQERQRAQVWDEKATQLNQELNQLKAKNLEATAFKDKNIEVGRILENHIYWSQFFSWLEKNTLSSVSYGGFGGDLSGIYSLGATAQTFADVSWQTNVFLKDPLVRKVEVTSVSSNASKDSRAAGNGQSVNEKVTFGLILEISPDIFKK